MTFSSFFFFLLVLSLCSVSHVDSFSRLSLFIHNTPMSTKSSFNNAQVCSSVENSDLIPVNTDIGGLEKVKRRIATYYKFSRPHTIKGTILASSMGVIRALKENPHSISINLVPKALIGLFALLCGNFYIVGINQIYDVEIDKINKPYLPIAANTLSKGTAWIVILTALVTGLLTVKYNFSPVIAWLYVAGVVAGTCYSLPGIQFKQHPILAALTIAFVRGFLLNFGIYYAVREALAIPFQWSAAAVFLAAVMTSFAAIIAVTKDLPDIEGDQRHHIHTFASQYGAKHVALLATVALSVTYLGAVLLPMLCLAGALKHHVLLTGHALALIYLWFQYTLLVRDQSSVKQFYKAIWDLFYFEYLLYPFI